MAPHNKPPQMELVPTSSLNRRQDHHHHHHHEDDVEDYDMDDSLHGGDDMGSSDQRSLGGMFFGSGGTTTGNSSTVSASAAALPPQRWRRLPMEDDNATLGSNDDYMLPGTNILCPNGRLRLLGVIVVLLAILALLVPKSNGSTTAGTGAMSGGQEEPYAAKKFKGTPQYTCPYMDNTTIITPEVDNNPNYDAELVDKYQELALNISKNLTYYVDNFRDNATDYFNGYTYNEVKDAIRDWKKDKFLNNLKTGSSIYESGSGIGLMLLLTLEILHEENDLHYLTDLHVYGNEVVAEAADVANQLIDTLAPSIGNGHRGVICPADSVKLHEFVPEDSFDLVYTSFLPPLPDPLGLLLDNPSRPWENKNHMKHLCDATPENSDDHYWESQALRRWAQEKQNDWYGTWVYQMIQIAKPGVPVIIEFVPPPFCDTHTDRGGVTKDFWTDANNIDKYKWNIDPESIEIQNDSLNPHMHHVFMRKKS